MKPTSSSSPHQTPLPLPLVGADAFSPFSPEQQGSVQAAMLLLKQHAPAAHETLHAYETRLVRLGLLLQDYPSLTTPQDFGFALYNLDVLLDQLCSQDPLELKLHLPSKAVLAEGYMATRIQQLRSLYLAVRSLEETSIPDDLSTELFARLSHSIHTYLLCQLLMDLVLSNRVSRPIKRVSASYLVSLWDRCTGHDSLNEFFVLIHSLWESRRRVRVQYGTLLGTSELLQLVEAQCDPRVLAYFTERELTEDEAYAFQEFLFGLSYEELQCVRSVMQQRGAATIGPEEVLELLGPGRKHNPNTTPTRDPNIVYRSYKKRRMQARYRRNHNLAGPLQTAEESLLHDLLQKSLQNPS